MLDKLFEWFQRPTINRNGFAKEIGIKTQYFDVMRKRNSISQTMKKQIVFQLQVEIKAAQNLINQLETSGGK